MSSEHKCTTETFSNKILQETKVLDLCSPESNSSVTLEQDIVTNDINKNLAALQNNCSSLPLSTTTLTYPNSSLDCVKQKISSDTNNITCIPAIISQTNKANTQALNSCCTSTLEQLHIIGNGDHQSNLSCNETLNSFSAITEDFNHLDGHHSFHSAGNNKAVHSHNDVMVINSNNSLCSADTRSEKAKCNSTLIGNFDKPSALIEQLYFEDPSKCPNETLNRRDSFLPKHDLIDHDSQVVTVVQNGQPVDNISHEQLQADGVYQEKQECFIADFESDGCNSSNITENLKDVRDKKSSSLVNGLPKQTSANSQAQSTCNHAVMQTVIEGTLQPLSISNSEQKEYVSVVEDDDSSSLFAGVSQEMILLDQESSNVLEMIGNNSVEAVKLESDVGSENLEKETCLTDISVPVNLNGGLCSLEPSIMNSESSIVSTEFGHILELDGKPSYLKLLPLKNGHSLWDMHDLRLAVSQHGTVHLRLCAAPDSTDRSINGPQHTFSALFLDDEIPPNSSDVRFHTSTDKVKVTESRSSQTSFEHLHSSMDLTQNTCEVSMSEYSYGLNTSDLPSVAPIRRSCLPPPMSNASFPEQPIRGKKRGRPPLHNKGEILGSISAFSGALEGASIPFNIGKKSSSMGSIWKKYEKLQKSEDLVCKDGTGLNAEEDRELSLGYKKLLSLTCVQCGAIFRNKTTLLNHVKSKHRLFKKCRICHERIHLQDKYSLKRHLLKSHKDREQLMCSKCNLSFKVILHLKRHDTIIHETSDSSDISSCELGNESDTEGQHSPMDESHSTVHTNQQIDHPQHLTKQNECVNQATPPKAQSHDDIGHLETTADDATNNRQLRSGAGSKNNCPSKAASGDSSSDSDESGNESDAEDSSDSDEEMAAKCKKFFCHKCEEPFSDKSKLDYHRVNKCDKVDSADEKESSIKQYPIKLTRNPKIVQRNSKQGKMVAKNPSLVDRTNVRGRPRRSATQSTRACTRSGKYFSENTPTPVGRQNYSSSRTSRAATRKEDESADSDTDTDKKSSSTKMNRPSYIIRKGRLFYCSKCNVSFKREKMMTYHLKKIHETLYPFRACPDCGKIFRSCGPFNRHLSQHRFTYCPADGCHAKYRNIRLVKKHQKNGHPDYPHRCHRCVHLFKRKNHLNQHLHEAHVQKNQEEDKDDDGSEEEVEEEMETVRKDRVNSKETSPAVVSGKRDRHGPVSYKEVDEDEFASRRRAYGPRKRTASQMVDATSPVKTANKKFKPAKLKAKASNSCIKSKIFSNKLANIIFKPSSKTKKCAALSPKQTATVVSGKKKLSTSWTAALKAKYQANKLPKQVILADPVNKSSKPKNSQSSSPAITDDVIRRVSDSLLSRKGAEISVKPKADKKAAKAAVSPAKVRRDDSVVVAAKDYKRCSDQKPLTSPRVASPTSQISEDTPANVLEFDLF